MRRFDEAIDAFLHAYEVDSRDSSVLTQAGFLLYQQGRGDEAEQLFRRVCELDRQAGSPRVGLAMIAMDRKDVKEAARCWRKRSTCAKTMQTLGARAGRLRDCVSRWAGTGVIDPRRVQSRRALRYAFVLPLLCAGCDGSTRAPAVDESVETVGMRGSGTLPRSGACHSRM